ncbi:MAG: hypothetical protein [Caudoviricetes sp.]|nr:MAG: hypothetical protein [Caudoviricetes sp.]
MPKLIYVLKSYNGTGGYSRDSGSFEVETQNDVNRCIQLLERSTDGEVFIDLIGDRGELKLPSRHHKECK